MFRQIALTVVLVTAFAAAANAQQPNNYASGVRNSSGTDRLNEKLLQMVRESLRQKSGFVELGFDQDGTLTLGNRENIAGGSATARALLVKAVDGADLYELESHDSSPEVAFARDYEAATWKDSKTGMFINIHRIQLDFADLNRLSGARKAKAAFDMGIVLLHELVHAVLNLKDPQGGMNQIGECDAHVNQMRRELRLPERLFYHPDVTVVELHGNRIVHARLTFVERATATAQPSATYSLNWLPGQISPKARDIAAFQQGLLAGQNR